MMIATAAESNPSCFLSEPLEDLEETLIPDYFRMVCVENISRLENTV